MKKRVDALRAAVQDSGVDGVIVTKQQNWQYLSGFTGSNAILLITEKESILVTDFRYLEQAARETNDFQIVKQTGLAVDTLAEQVEQLGLKKLGFEDEGVTYHEYEVYKEKMPDVELQPLHHVIEKIRWVKDSGEISLLQ
ncbi:MAG TPA: aminopeptidase P family N-terminal domain-containing protein, partial [Desulfobacteria bacterium]|nr:aminopeptidase P family N-terminal domain-containing protein [Desulfobacteria bacterium]